MLFYSDDVICNSSKKGMCTIGLSLFAFFLSYYTLGFGLPSPCFFILIFKFCFIFYYFHFEVLHSFSHIFMLGYFLHRLEENDILVLTPFEKNLDIWRQLWRVVERSDLVGFYCFLIT